MIKICILKKNSVGSFTYISENVQKVVMPLAVATNIFVPFAKVENCIFEEKHVRVRLKFPGREKKRRKP